MRSQHVAFTERNALLNKIHEALVDVTGHSDQTEILEKVAFSSPPSEELQGSSQLVSSAVAALVIIALQRLTNCTLVPFYCFHPHARVRLVPLNDLCRRVVGCVCSWGGLPKQIRVLWEPTVLFLETLVSTCLVLLYRVGVRVKLTLRPLTVLHCV